PRALHRRGVGEAGHLVGLAVVGAGGEIQGEDGVAHRAHADRAGDAARGADAVDVGVVAGGDEYRDAERVQRGERQGRGRVAGVAAGLVGVVGPAQAHVDHAGLPAGVVGDDRIQRVQDVGVAGVAGGEHLQRDDLGIGSDATGAGDDAGDVGTVAVLVGGV